MPQHDSSFVRGVGYDWDEQVLTVRLGGRTYQYQNVPEPVYQKLLHSESLGRAFNRHVKGFYSFTEITKEK